MEMRAQERAAGRALFFTDRRETLKLLAAEVAAPSTVVQFGKRKSASAGMQTKQATPEELSKFDQRLKDMNTSAPTPTTKPAPSLDVNQSLLSEAIHQMMKETQNG